jgi:hypothetical protein
MGLPGKPPGMSGTIPAWVKDDSTKFSNMSPRMCEWRCGSRRFVSSAGDLNGSREKAQEFNASDEWLAYGRNR